MRGVRTGESSLIVEDDAVSWDELSIKAPPVMSRKSDFLPILKQTRSRQTK